MAKTLSSMAFYNPHNVLDANIAKLKPRKTRGSGT